MTNVAPTADGEGTSQRVGPVDHRTARWFALLAAAITLIVYRRVVGFEFLTWDDDQHVTENPYFNPLSWMNVLHFWGYSYIYLYIPVSYDFFAFEAWLSQWFPGTDPTQKFNPAIFHGGNLLLHVGCTLLAYRLILRLVPNTAAALVGALLFAVHPLQSESVCWIGETRGTLCTLFSLLAWWFYLRSAPIDAAAGIFAERPPPEPPFRRRDYAAATLCYAAALLSKPSAASLPLLIVAVDLMLLRRSWRTTAARTALWFAAAAVITGLTKYYQRTDIIHAPAVARWHERPFVAGDAYAFYLEKLVLPLDQAFDYGRTPFVAASGPWFYYRWLLPVGVLLILAALPRRRIWIGCYSIFLLAIAPVSGIVPFLFQSISTVADRYMYVPMFGFGLMAATWIATRREPKYAILVAGFVLALLAGRTFEQNELWRDDWIVFQNGLRITPRSYMAHVSLGNRYRAARQFSEAISHYDAALTIRSDYAYARYHRGLCQAELGRLESAVADFERTVADVPWFVGAWVGLGDALSRREQWPAAIDAYRNALMHDAKEPTAMLGLAKVRFRTGDAEEGRRLLEQAASLRPDSAETARTIGRIWLEAERWADAVKALERAVELDPNSPQARTDLAGCLLRLGKFAPAAAEAGEAVRLDPQSFEARNNLGLALAAAGRIDAAREQLTTAARLAPPADERGVAVRRALEQLQP